MAARLFPAPDIPEIMSISNSVSSPAVKRDSGSRQKQARYGVIFAALLRSFLLPLL